MSESIGVGDRVMLVWACCPDQRREIGYIGTVNNIRSGRARCPKCGTVLNPVTAAEVGDGIWPLSWLKKMPPDGERVEEREESEVTA